MIGEHTEYNDGFVLPAAIEFFVWVARLPHDLSLVICNTMVQRKLVSSEYSTCRRECKEGIRLLGHRLPRVRALRDLTLAEFVANAGALSPKELEEIAFGQRFRLAPDQIFVIGGSFSGAAAVLLSLDPRVNRVVANCPVVDWSILDAAEKAETSKPSYAE